MICEFDFFKITPVGRSASRESALSLGPKGMKEQRENNKRGFRSTVSNITDSPLQMRISSPIPLPPLSYEEELPTLEERVTESTHTVHDEPHVKINGDAPGQGDENVNGGREMAVATLDDFSELFNPSSEVCICTYDDPTTHSPS